MENKTHKEIKTLYILLDWFQNFPVIAHTHSHKCSIWQRRVGKLKEHAIWTHCGC